MPKGGRGSGEKGFGGNVNVAVLGKGEVEEESTRIHLEGTKVQFYSHSVVPGGLDVRSYITLEMPGIFLISLTILRTTCGQGSMS